TTTYMVTGTDGNGCKNTASKTITVNPLPNVVIDASANSICFGMNVTLIASGASIYTWSNGVINGVPFAPNTTKTYTVVGTDTITGCLNTSTKTITVNPLPNVGANANPISVCIGDPVTLTGSGASTYEWSNGVLNGIPFIPTSTATYAVTGTDSNGCQNTAIKTITVSPLPTVDLGADTIKLMSGQQINLIATASGAGLNYLWSTGETTSTITVIMGTAGTVYFVTVTNNAGCTATDAVVATIIVSTDNPDDNYRITVTPNPTYDVVSITCGGSSTSLVQIIDNLGRVVAEDYAIVLGGAIRTLNLAQLPASTYHLRIVGKGFVRTISIVKQ
ncbi:MAG: T9SS type A sorting domain-containing protein, partial [Bacteroidia bacterium]|nr:T9SS type A sorting domain-containing protein [Bacteroidia bacterium]